MNNSFVLNRIQSQVKKIEHTPRIEPSIIVQKKKEISEPLKETQIKNLLMSELEIKSEIKEEIITEKTFNLISFVDWYVSVRTNFTEPMQKSIDTIVQARTLIDKGCGCQKGNRTNRADDYFKSFWENNVKTDMIIKVSEILGIKKIKFTSRGNVFLDLNLP